MNRYIRLFMLLIILSIPLGLTSVDNFQQQLEPKAVEFEYEVIDTYADGTEKVREIRSSNDIRDFSKIEMDQTSHPLGDTKKALAGSAEVLLASYTDYSSSDDDHNDFHWIEHSRTENYTQTIETGGNEDYGAFSNTDTGKAAVGDVDGNFRQDFITAQLTSTFDSEIQLNVMEYWPSGEGEAATLATTSTTDVFGGIQTNAEIPSVFAYQADDDYMSEFIVMGYLNGAFTAFVFDDLLSSQEPVPLRFQDDVSFQNKFSNVFNFGSTSDVFFFDNPDATNANGKIYYGDETMIRQGTDKLLSYDNQTGTFSVRTDDGNYTDNDYFTIAGTSGNAIITGSIYQNNHIQLIPESSGQAGSSLGPIYKVMNGSNPINNFRDTSLPILANITVGLDRYYTPNSIEKHYETVATGNIDSDPYDEIIIVGTQSSTHVVKVYDDASASFALLKTITPSVSSKLLIPSIGDVDKDGISEIVVAMSDATSSTLDIYEGTDDNYSLKTTVINQSTTFIDIEELSVEDIDDDGVNEIMFVDADVRLSIIENYSNTFQLELVNEVVGYTGDGGSNSYGRLDFDDIDADGTREIVVLFDHYAYGGSEGGWGLSMHTWSSNNLTTEYSAYHILETLGFSVSLAVGDFNGDQFTVEYRDEVGGFTTLGEIEAITAAPPTQLGLSQNYVSSGTTFGSGVSSSTSFSESISTGYSWYASIDLSVSFLDIYEVGPTFSYTLSQAFTETNTVTTTRTETRSHTGGYLDDLVIYTTALYKTYNYTIVDSPLPSMEGEIFQLNVPGEVNKISATKEFFNDNRPAGEIPIDDRVFTHTPGSVDTYSSLSELQTSTASSMIQSQKHTVGQGGGSTTVEINLEDTDTTGFEASYQQDVEVGFEAKVFGVGGSVSYTTSKGGSTAYEVSVGSSTNFAGSVGSIEDASEYEQYQYSYGMVIYKQELTFSGRSQGFYVINYWVDLPEFWTPPSTSNSTSLDQSTSEISSEGTSVSSEVEDGNFLDKIRDNSPLPLSLSSVLSAILIPVVVIRWYRE